MRFPFNNEIVNYASILFLFKSILNVFILYWE